jgi:hypothetical protein
MTLVGTEDGVYKYNAGDSKEVINAKAEGLKRAEYTRELLSHPEKLGPAEITQIQGFVLEGLDTQSGFTNDVIEKAKAAKTDKERQAILQPLFDQIPPDVINAYKALGGDENKLHEAFMHAADRKKYLGIQSDSITDAEIANIAAALAPVTTSLGQLTDAAREKLLDKIPDATKDVLALVKAEDAGKAKKDLEALMQGGKDAEAAGKDLQALIGKGLDSTVKFAKDTASFTDGATAIAAAKELAAKAGLSDDFGVDLKRGYEGKEDKAVALEDVMQGVRKAIDDAAHSPATGSPPTRAAAVRTK